MEEEGGREEEEEEGGGLELVTDARQGSKKKGRKGN
jgi:hypothetical protein